MILRLALIAAGLWALAPTTSLAQDSSAVGESEGAEARALFRSASEAIQEGRFAEARDLLRRSLELAPTRGAAFNLGVALRGTGEMGASISVFRRLVSGEFGELQPEQLAEVQSLLEEVRTQRGRLLVSACGAERVEVRVDGEQRATLERCGEQSIGVDPGAHVVRFDAEHAQSVERESEVGAGETVEVAATLVVVEPTPVVVEDPAASPWLWLGVTGGVLLIAGAVLAGVLLTDPPRVPHVIDGVYGEVIALTF